jgi:hypothetical protein
MLKTNLFVTRIARLCRNFFFKENFPCSFFPRCFFYAIPIIILSGLTSSTFAQEKAKKVAGTFVYQSKAYNYEFNKLASNNYSFVINSLTDSNTASTGASSSTETDSTPSADTTANAENNSSDTTSNTQDAAPSSIGTTTNQTAEKSTSNEIFDEFSKEVFRVLFQHQMITKYGINEDNESKNLLNKKSLELFFIIQSKLEFLDDEPVTAHMILKKDRVNSILISNSSSFYNASLSYPVIKHNIKSVDIETEDGTIKNIIVLLEAKNSRGSLEFKNTYPISISGKHDAERLSKIRLYSFNCNGIEGLNRYILFSDILELDITLENDKEDYSPANKTFKLTPQSSVVELKKEKRSQILSVAAFSDFVGLDQEQPNGLLQIEAKRKININTNYLAVSSFWGGQKKRDLDEQISNYDLGKYSFRRIDTIQSKKSDYSTYQVLLKKAWLAETYKNTISFPDSLTANKYVKEHPGASKKKIDNVWVVKSRQKFKDTISFSDFLGAYKHVREHPGDQVKKENDKWILKTNQRIAFPDSASADKYVQDTSGNQITKVSGKWIVTDQKYNISIPFSDSTGADKYVKKYSGNQLIKKGVWLIKTNKNFNNVISFTDSLRAIKYVKEHPDNQLIKRGQWAVEIKQKPLKPTYFTDSIAATKYQKENPKSKLSKIKPGWVIKINKKPNDILFTDSTIAIKYVKDNPSSQLKNNNVVWFVKTNKTVAFPDSVSAAVYVIRNPQHLIIEAQNVPYEVIKVANRNYKFGYYAWIPSIEPKLLFSKLDGNNKFLNLDSAYSSTKSINPLKQFQYQLASFGLTTSILKIAYPQSKLTWNVLDVGTFWYRTRVQNIQDTATNNSVAVNNGYISFGSQLAFKPDSRWGANVGATFIMQKAFNNEYKFEKNHGLTQFNFDAFIKTNEDSKMFFRFRWLFDGHTFQNNFTQIQLGYSVNIFANSGASK